MRDLSALPVQARNTAETINVCIQSGDDLGLRGFVEPPVLAVALGVFGDKLATHRFRRGLVVVAVETDPFGKMIGDIKCRRGGNGIFIVDKVDRGDVIRT